MFTGGPSEHKGQLKNHKGWVLWSGRGRKPEVRGWLGQSSA